MEDNVRSFGATLVLCIVLVAGNYWVMTQKTSIFGYLALWPVAFILCVWIAARIWHGHNSV